MTENKAISVIKYLNFCGICTTGPCVDCERKQAKDEALSALEEIQRYREIGIVDWIPCNELLPDIGDDVLITNKNGRVEIGTWWGERWSTPYRHSIEGVIAWMPKPRGYVQ